MIVFSTLVQWECTHQFPRAQNLRRSAYTGGVGLLSSVGFSKGLWQRPG